jgi:hypothetical protein
MKASPAGYKGSPPTECSRTYSSSLFYCHPLLPLPPVLRKSETHTRFLSEIPIQCTRVNEHAKRGPPKRTRRGLLGNDLHNRAQRAMLKPRLGEQQVWKKQILTPEISE